MKLWPIIPAFTLGLAAAAAAFTYRGMRSPIWPAAMPTHYGEDISADGKHIYFDNTYIAQDPGIRTSKTLTYPWGDGA